MITYVQSRSEIGKASTSVSNFANFSLSKLNLLKTRKILRSGKT